jgi:folate-dependent phosphoribosylglycinamide formyltransferase PurN
MYGVNVHRAVLESGMKVSGCTVHFVDEQYDTGPIIVQTAVPVQEDDTPETLAARVLPEENRAFVRAVQLFAAGRLRVEGRRVHVKEEGDQR